MIKNLVFSTVLCKCVKKEHIIINVFIVIGESLFLILLKLSYVWTNCKCKFLHLFGNINDCNLYFFIIIIVY